MSEMRWLTTRVPLLLADLVFCALGILFFCGQRTGLPLPPFPVWAAAAGAGLLLNAWIHHKGGMQNTAVFFTAALCIGTGVWTVREMASEEFSVWMICMVFLMGASPVLHSALLAHGEVRKDRQVLYLDGLTAAAVFLLFCESGDTLPGVRVYLVWAFLAMALLMASLILSRAQTDGPGAGIPLLLLVLLGGCAWTGGLLLPHAAAAAVSLCRRISGLFLQLLQAVLHAGARFLAWLARILPLPASEMPLEELQPAAAAPAYETPANAGPDPRLLAVIACLLLLGAGVWVWRQLRGLRWQPLSGNQVPPARDIRKSGRGRCRKWLADLWQRLLFTLRYLLHRHTPEGMLTRMERRAARAGSPRRKDESAPAFLRRLAADADEKTGRQLLQLAARLERTYYSGL